MPAPAAVLDPGLAWVEALGYRQPRQIPGVGICAIRPFLFTGGLVVGIDQFGYYGRYCYASLTEAILAIETWSGNGDPPGSWIKFKSTQEERLGPGCS